MGEFKPYTGIFAVGAVAALLCASAAPRLAAEQGASMPDFSSHDASWVFGNTDYVAIPGEPSPTRNDPAHPSITNNEFRAPGRSRRFALPISAMPISSRGRRKS